MGVRDTIAALIEESLESGDDVRASTLRLVQCAISDREAVARAQDRINGCEEREIRAILEQMVRQRESSARSYEDSGRPDMAERERREITVIAELLPRQMDEGQIRVAAEEVVDELGASGLKDVGRCMGALKKRYDGRMDFTQAGAVVKTILS